MGLMAWIRLRTVPDPRGFGTHEQLGFAPCGLRDALGVPCPTCGVTTSVSHALRGEFVDAWFTQPLGLILPPLALVLAVTALRIHAAGDDLVLVVARASGATWTMLLMVVVTCWLVAL